MLVSSFSFFFIDLFPFALHQKICLHVLYSRTFCMIAVMMIASRYFNVARKQSLPEMQEEK
jgi:hypothetical protein